MSINYDLTVTPALSEEAVLDYVAAALGCDRRYSDPPAVGRGDELRVSAVRIATEADPELRELLDGASESLTILFRPFKFLTDDHDAKLFGEILEAAVRFFEDFPDAKGTFTFQGETIYAQRLGGEGIVFDQIHRDPEYNSDGILDVILENYLVRQIEQVFR
jgi:hypothetical protein